jgi:hypothetical protein
MSIPTFLPELTSFGAAGLLAAMWLIERRLNRRRESQLNEAHDRICRDEERLSVLTDVVGRNNAAIVKFLQHQQHQTEILKHLVEDIHHGRLS